MQYSKVAAGVAACINLVNGTYELNESIKYIGNAPCYTTKAEHDDFANLFGPGYQDRVGEVFTVEELRAALTGAGPDEIQSWLTDFTVENIMEMHAKR
jgi:hypothetical protein